MIFRLPRFKIGFTFSGNYRDRVSNICKNLVDIGFDATDIFYDGWHDDLIVGIGADAILQEIYNKKCDLVVVLLSPDYGGKVWTGNIEWPAVRDLINCGKREKICLLKTGKVDINKIDGLFKSRDIYKDIDNISDQSVAEFIQRKYNRTRIFKKTRVREHSQVSSEVHEGLIRQNVGCIEILSVSLYAEGIRGRVKETIIEKDYVETIGMEIVLRNQKDKDRDVHIGLSVKSLNSERLVRKFSYTLGPNIAKVLYVKIPTKFFRNMRGGNYSLHLALNDNPVCKTEITIK